jgi:glyoxylase-like metal-dependent hydrolase (beta-lactamase superfamily II)
MITRRSFVQRTGLAGLSLLAAAASSQRAFADPDPSPNAKPPAPASPSLPDPDIYPFALGGHEAFVIHDGALTSPGIQPSFAPEASKAELDQLLTQEYLPTDHVVMSVNVLVVKSDAGVMLFDGGAGRAFGPAAGRLVSGLAKIGVSPADVKWVFVTHAHPDHIGGLVDGSNGLVFPSAKIIASKSEVDFWNADAPDLSGMRTPPESRAQMAGMIKTWLGVLKPNLELKGPGKIAPAVELVASPGHTPGHAMFLVSQGDDKLLVLGDIVHVWSLQFPHPEWTMAYDVDPRQAVATRRKVFEKAAADRTLLAGYHLPFPGLGHARAAGRGYQWVARPWVT